MSSQGNHLLECVNNIGPIEELDAGFKAEHWLLSDKAAVAAVPGLDDALSVCLHPCKLLQEYLYLSTQLMSEVLSMTLQVYGNPSPSFIFPVGDPISRRAAMLSSQKAAGGSSCIYKIHWGLVQKESSHLKLVSTACASKSLQA